MYAYETLTEPIPDISAAVSGPSRWGDAATYFLFSVGGLFLGGELGLITGTASASRTITKVCAPCGNCWCDHC